MPSRRSATSSWSTRRTSAATARTCRRSRAGPGGGRRYREASARPRPTTSEPGEVDGGRQGGGRRDGAIGHAGSGWAAQAVWLRPGPARRDGGRALRAAPPVRQRCRSRRRGPARAVRGRRPLGQGHPLAALGADRADLRASEPEAGLLYLDGVPDRALARQQHREPPPRPARQSGRRREGPRLARGARGGARRGPGQRRARPPRGVLRRVDGDDAASGGGLRAAPRGRHLQAGDPGRLAGGAAGQLAAAAGPVGGRPAAGAGGDQPRLLVRGARRQPRRDHGPPVQPARHPVRPPGGGLRRRDGQHAPPLGRGRTRFFRLPDVQPRRVRERARRAARGRVPDPGPLPRRLDQHGSGAALRAGILPRRLLAGRPRAALPPGQRRLGRAAREGRDPAQRHPPGARRARADAHPARRGGPRLGPGLGPREAHARLHEPHAPARGAGEVAAAVGRAAAAAPPRDPPRDHPPFPRRGAGPPSRRRGPRRARQPGRGGRRAADPDGQPRYRRLAQHERRRRHPLGPAAEGDGQGSGRAVPRALQQQDQRRHPAPLAPARQPGSRRRHHGRHRRGLDHRPRRAEAARAARRRRGLPRRRPQGQAGGEVAFRAVAGRYLRRQRRPGLDLRQPSQAHPRVQAAVAERAARRGALRPAPAGPGRRGGAAHLLLRRQGGARLPPGQADHQVPQQPGRHARRRPGGARPPQGRVPAGVQRVARRAADPGLRRLEPDLDRRLRGERHEQHEVHDERGAHDRHARRRHDRDGRGRRRGELLPVRPHRGAGGRQPRLVRSPVALRPRAGDPRGPRADRLGPPQPARARDLRSAPRHPAGPRRPLPAPGRPRRLPRGGPPAGRALRRPGGLGAQGDPEHRQRRHVLERPHDRRVRGGDLAGEALPGDVGTDMPEAGSGSPLGATPCRDGTNFSLFSRHATGVELLLFDRVDDAKPARTVRLDPVANRTYHYWHAFVPGVAAGQAYGYRVEGPWDPASGMRFDPAKVLLAPYARAVVVPDGYDREAARHPGDTGATAMRSVVVDSSTYDWEGDRPLRRPSAQTIIYEMHVRGFTRHPSSGVAERTRGTYAGLIEKIPYLQRLGITAVELLPVFQFDAQDCPPGKVNYWGYAPVSFFAPHQAYSSRRDPLGPVDEFRDMVKALHRAGIEVILDVVFNHTAESDHGGPTLGLRGVDNPTYYILEPDQSRYANFTGTGNTLNANHPVVRRMIVDSLRHWVEQMHVDGFRFDLASVLARDPSGRPLPNPPVLWDIESEPALAGTKLIAEAWDAAGLYQVGSFVGDAWKEWNGRFRDDVRAFFRAEPDSTARIADRLVGSPGIYGHKEREAEQSVNFVTCHDGFTLNDLVSYDRKHNEANGENNRDGGDDNRSWNSGVEGPSDDPAVEKLRNRQVRNFLTVTLLSLGMPMILMGDEVLRTQYGNNNAYCQDNEVSWFDWNLVEKHADLHRFVTLLNAWRRLRDMTHERQRWSLNELIRHASKTWHGVKIGQPDWGEHSHAFAFEARLHQKGLSIYLILNAYWESLEFELPPVGGTGSWRRWIDPSLEPPQEINPWEAAVPLS